MRNMVRLALVSSLLAIPAAAFGYATEEAPPTPVAIAALQARAEQAAPREQCFLLAEVVHQMTEMAGRQLADGDSEHAAATLHQIQAYAERIHVGLANDTKRLKNTELLMRHTSFRLTEYLHNASNDDRPTVQAALKRLEQVQTELMMQVFRH